MRARWLVVMMLSITSAVTAARGQELVRCPIESRPLNERWNWASGEGARDSKGDAFWIGYSIKRLMQEGSYISAGEELSGWTSGRKSLADFVSGNQSGTSDHDQTTVRDSHRDYLLVAKDVAILIQASADRAGKPKIDKIEIVSMDLYAELHSRPLLWLGSADDDESVGLLTGLYDSMTAPRLRKQLVEAVGVHQRSSAAYPFLREVLQGNDADEVRTQASFWMSQQDNPKALEDLLSIARRDRSMKVREQAVFAISQIHSDGSIEALIDLARKADDVRIRGKAAFWLGEKASQKAVAALEDILENNDEVEVQRQALYALAREKNPETMTRLIKVAETHRSPRVRKAAIQLLGQSDDPRALDELVKIVRK